MKDTKVCFHCGRYIKPKHQARMCVIEDGFIHRDCDMFKIEFVIKHVNIER